MALEVSARIRDSLQRSERSSSVRRAPRSFRESQVAQGGLTQIGFNAGPRRHAVSEVEAEIRKFYQGPLPLSDALPFSAPFRDFFIGYDDFKEARKALIWRHGKVTELGVHLA